MSISEAAATLPHEMLQRIMCLLCHDVRAVFLVPRVSKHWAAAADSGSLWRRMSETRWPRPNSSPRLDLDRTDGNEDRYLREDHDSDDRGSDDDIDQGCAKRKFLQRSTGICLEAASVVCCLLVFLSFCFACCFACVSE